ncbi:MAG: hypothetical protein HC769_25340 [Cyanobacteria bacterium CRU_2_1]|nr:hypothetical protein [Cyanobacteria bacterium RU_5_0]NJR61860.1 hypothetical protein [Cyanobacteria bacterium CRU_2_1]
MTESKETQTTFKLKSDEGFPVGLGTWVLFILIFWGLGLPATLMILLGAIAGAAVWLIVSYLRADKIEEEKPEEPPEALKPVDQWFNQLRLPGFTSRLPNLVRRKPIRRLGGRRDRE